MTHKSNFEAQVDTTTVPSKASITLEAKEQALGRYELAATAVASSELNKIRTNPTLQERVKTAAVAVEVGIDATQHGINQLYNEKTDYWKRAQNGMRMLLNSRGSRLNANQKKVANDFINLTMGVNFDRAAAVFDGRGTVSAQMKQASRIDKSFRSLHAFLYKNWKVLSAMNIDDDSTPPNTHDMLSMALAFNRGDEIYKQFLSNSGLNASDRSEATTTLKIIASKSKHSANDRYAKLSLAFATEKLEDMTVIQILNKLTTCLTTGKCSFPPLDMLIKITGSFKRGDVKFKDHVETFGKITKGVIKHPEIGVRKAFGKFISESKMEGVEFTDLNSLITGFSGEVDFENVVVPVVKRVSSPSLEQLDSLLAIIKPYVPLLRLIKLLAKL